MGDYSAKQSSSLTGLGWLLRAHVRFWVEEEVKEGADDKGNVKKGDENAEMRITAQDGISSDYHLSRLKALLEITTELWKPLESQETSKGSGISFEVIICVGF